MLGAKNSGSTQTNPNYQTLLVFKPRQVLLAERTTKVTTMKQCSSKTLTLNPDQKAILLQSVIGYLDRNGFSKALKRLLAEAQIETDNWKACSLNLEDLYGNYLGTCTPTKTILDTDKVQELLTDETKKKSGASHSFAIEQTIGNRKKKKSNKGDNNAVENGIAESCKNSMEILAKDSLADSSVELKEKKKSKKVSDSHQQPEQVSTEALKKSTAVAVSELQIDESQKKQTDKKKKKSKSISESHDSNVEREPMDSLQVANEDKFDNSKPSLGEVKTDSEAGGKPKDKKKKKKKQSADLLIENVEKHNSALENGQDVPLEEKKVESRKQKRKKEGSVSDMLSGDVPNKEDPTTRETKNKSCQTLEDAIGMEKKSSKKRKRLVSEENELLPVEKVKSEESKRRKTETLEETKICEQITEVNANAATPTNRNFEKDGVKSAAQKTRRKQHEGSAEPTTGKAFQRVKIDEVKFADERLQDNSYWAKAGADIGYGAKAQEILGQVKGRDFRHEKTKKKRGSYRGGQIDLQAHSVKFNYSDED